MNDAIGELFNDPDETHSALIGFYCGRKGITWEQIEPPLTREYVNGIQKEWCYYQAARYAGRLSLMLTAFFRKENPKIAMLHDGGERE